MSTSCSLGFASAAVNLLLFVVVVMCEFEGAVLPYMYSVAGVSVGLASSLLLFKYAAVTLLACMGWRHLCCIRMQLFELLFLLSVFPVAIASIFYIAFSEARDLGQLILYVFPFVLFFAGRVYSKYSFGMKPLLALIMPLSFCSSVYAIADVLLVDEYMWKDLLRQSEYLIDVKGYTRGIVDGVIGNFYYDPYGLRIRRAVGFQGDPLSFSYSIVLPFLLFFCFFLSVKGGSKFLVLIPLVVLVCALYLSMTRAVMLSVVCVCAISVLFYRLAPYFAFLLGFCVVVGLIFFGEKLLFMAGDSSFRGHLHSLTSFCDMPLHGIVFGSLISENKLLTFESAFLKYIANFGVVVAFVVYGFWVSVLRFISCEKGWKFRAIYLSGLTGMLTSMIFSESALSFTAFGMVWFIMGAACQEIKVKVEGSYRYAKVSG